MTRNIRGQFGLDYLLRDDFWGKQVSYASATITCPTCGTEAFYSGEPKTVNESQALFLEMHKACKPRQSYYYCDCTGVKMATATPCEICFKTKTPREKSSEIGGAVGWCKVHGTVFPDHECKEAPREKSTPTNHKHRDNQDGTGYCLDCGDAHPDTTPAMFCDHANEVPSNCTCDDNCYCKTHTCKPHSICECDKFQEPHVRRPTCKTPREKCKCNSQPRFNCNNELLEGKEFCDFCLKNCKS